MGKEFIIMSEMVTVAAQNERDSPSLPANVTPEFPSPHLADKIGKTLQSTPRIRDTGIRARV